MSADKDHKGQRKGKAVLATATAAMTEQGAVAAAGIAGGAFGGPLGAMIGTVAVKGAASVFRHLANLRGEKRAHAFEEEVAKAFDLADEPALAALCQDEHFGEVIFQNYRRAMDALDPCAVRALGRLTVAYRDRSIDGFFRSLGQLLEELSPSELMALQTILSAVDEVAKAIAGSAATIEITPLEASQRLELRFAVESNRQRALGVVAPIGSLRVLSLIRRLGFAEEVSVHGADLAFESTVTVKIEECRRAAEIVGRTNVDVFETSGSLGISVDGRGK